MLELPVILPRLLLSLCLAPSSSLFVLLFLNVTFLIVSLRSPQQHNAAKGNLQNTEMLAWKGFSSLPAIYLSLPL